MTKPLYLRARDWIHWRLGPGLSAFGERIGSNALVYNPILYYSFHSLAQRNAPVVIGAIADLFPDARRWLDVGAGSGAFAAEVQRAGRAVVACEYSRFGRRLARKQGIDALPFDLQIPVPAAITGHFDLAYCFEVAEHLPAALGDRLIDFICGHAPTVVFSAAQPGQKGSGHINEQPRKYWIDRFARLGFAHSIIHSDGLASKFAAARVSDWFINNVLVFERGRTA
jgi:SAM-dependent methyltransferase